MTILKIGWNKSDVTEWNQEGEEVNIDYQIDYYKKKIIDLKQEGRMLVIVPCGIGDLTVMWMLMYEREITDTWKSIVPIVTSLHWNRLLKFYPGKIEEALVLPRAIRDAIMMDKIFLKKHGIRNGYEFSGKHKIDNIKDYFCIMLDFSVNTEYRKFSIHSNCWKDVKTYFHWNQLIPGKTVFLCPYANTFGSEIVSRDYWKKLSMAVRRSGGGVFFNSQTCVVEGEPFGLLALQDLPDFVGLCGNAVGLRSGMMDFLAAFANIRSFVIWPNGFCPFYIYSQSTIRRFYMDFLARPKEGFMGSVADYYMQLYSVYSYTGSNNLVEWVHDTDEEAEIDRIVAELGF